MKKLLFALIPAAILLAGCSPSSSTSDSATPAPAAATGGSGSVAAIKKYPMHGKVIAVNADKSVRIEAGPIGDWMGAMTMNYTIKADADRAKMTEGTTFDATVFVNGDDFWVGDVNPAPAK